MEYGSLLEGVLFNEGIENASKREREWEEYSDDKAFYSFLFTARILENTVRLRKWGSILLT